MNAVQKVQDIVEAKYRNDVALVAMVDALRLAQHQVRSECRDHSSIIAGYRQSAAGEGRYSPLYSSDASLLTGMIREMSTLHDVGLITRLLVDALQRMGEEIEF